jgi:hypothetical protein
MPTFCLALLDRVRTTLRQRLALQLEVVALRHQLSFRGEIEWDAENVGTLLGHCTVTMTERYADLAPENVRAAVTPLDDARSRSGHVNASGEMRDTPKGSVTI